MKAGSQKILVGAATDPGRNRHPGPNQDSMAVSLPGFLHHQSPLFVIADGMGGHAGGAVASRLVIRSFLWKYRKSWNPENMTGLMEGCITQAHADIRKFASEHLEYREMGSTIVAVAVHAGQIFVSNVGDSRAYLCRGDRILQLSQDQSWVQEEVRAGRLTPEEAIGHEKRNALTMSLTAKRENITSVSGVFEAEPADTIILCTDGLWSIVPDSVLHAVASELPPQKAALKLIELANASISKDNISVIVATWRNPAAMRRPE